MVLSDVNSSEVFGAGLPLVSLLAQLLFMHAKLPFLELLLPVLEVALLFSVQC